MSIKSITLILENCEEVTFNYPSEVFMLHTGDIKEYFMSWGNSIGKQRYVDGFSIIFGKTCGTLGMFSPDENKLPIERLNQHKDVTGIRIMYDDGQVEEVGVSWDDTDSEFEHSGQKLVLTDNENALYYSETNNYQCAWKQDPEAIDSWCIF